MCALRTLWEYGPDVMGLEPLVIDDASREERAQYLYQRRQKSTESIPLKDPRPTRERTALEEPTVSNMWEIAALILANTCSPGFHLRFVRIHSPIGPDSAGHVMYPPGDQAHVTVYSLVTL